MNRIKTLFAAIAVTAASAASAQQTMDNMQLLTVNENITTVITAGEPIRFVDISTDQIAGDQPINNTVRLKPKEGADVHQDGDLLGVVTVVTERYRVQYSLIYTSQMTEAVTDKEILVQETTQYNNPDVSMSKEDMARYARRIWTSKANYRGVSTKMHKMVMRLNNVYSVGEYFFLDFSVENKTNIQFDIDQLRFKLEDKKINKATNVQTLELEPEFVLEPAASFKYGYRNVVVIKKLTFPNSKVLKIEMSEKQISGRNIFMTIDYEDVLSADSFSRNLLGEN